MIHHIVLFKLKQKADPVVAAEIFTELEGLLRGSPSVMQYAVNKVTPARAKLYQYVQFSAFEDMEGVETYRRMVGHEEIKNKIKKIARFDVVDYEV